MYKWFCLDSSLFLTSMNLFYFGVCSLLPPLIYKAESNDPLRNLQYWPSSDPDLNAQPYRPYSASVQFWFESPQILMEKVRSTIQGGCVENNRRVQFWTLRLDLQGERANTDVLPEAFSLEMLSKAFNHWQKTAVWESVFCGWGPKRTKRPLKFNDNCFSTDMKKRLSRDYVSN